LPEFLFFRILLSKTLFFALKPLTLIILSVRKKLSLAQRRNNVWEAGEAKGPISFSKLLC
jgi:hypothetical protein